jgi:hypothetical protein
MLMGSSSGASRTTDQTELADFWQAGNPPDFWVPVANLLAMERQFNLPQLARLFGATEYSHGRFDRWLWTPLIVFAAIPEFRSAHSCASGPLAGYCRATFATRRQSP